MDMMNRLDLRIALLLVLGLGLAGCSQGEGESCQLDRDCEDGLECNQTEGSRGECAKPQDIEEMKVDAKAPEDTDLSSDPEMDAAIDAGAPATDAGFDAAIDVDAGTDEDDAG